METIELDATRLSSRTRNRAIAVVAGLGVVALLVALGYVFSTSSGAQQVASSARSLHEANAAAGSAAVARASVAQAVVFAIDYELGVASVEARDAAIAEATNTLGATEYWVDPLKADTATRALGADLHTFTQSGEHIVELLVSGEPIDAEHMRQTDYESMYAALAASLEDRQSDIVYQIHQTERFAGAVGWIARVVATLLIPAAAIIAYFLLARRQFRDARLKFEAKMEAKLKAERELSVAKDEFIAGISHELRTPLTSIYGFSEYLLENEILDPDEAIELIGLINKDSAELSRMVDDLLTAARLEADALTFTFEQVNLRTETDEAIGTLTRSERQVQVNGEVHAWADPVRVRQIVRNLVSNAIKHGGESIGVYLESTGTEAIITVSDNGDGLTKEVEDRLFDRFVHDGNESLLMGSVGLGLSIAKSLAKTMGGDIRFVRASGWTNFEVVLPMTSDGQVESFVDDRESDPQRASSSETALAVG